MGDDKNKIETALKKGAIAGKEQGKIEVVKNSIKAGLDNTMIASIT